MLTISEAKGQIDAFESEKGVCQAVPASSNVGNHLFVNIRGNKSNRRKYQQFNED